MDGKMLVEKKVDSQKYSFDLYYELPLDLSISPNPQIKAWIKDFRQIFSPQGLLVNGTIIEEIEDSKQSQDIDFSGEIIEQTFYFTYLIPEMRLNDKDSINFEFDLQIEYINYHFIKKKGQVFLKQQFGMRLHLNQYSIEDSVPNLFGKLQKKRGFFLKKSFEIKESFLKVSPLRLPDDFVFPVNFDGRVEDFQLEIIQEGCLLDLKCKFQGEYVTTDKRLGTFFFQREENLFIPLVDQLLNSTEAHAQIDVKEITLEKNKDLLILYHCHIIFFQKKEVDYFTGDKLKLSDIGELNRIQVEQVNLPMERSQMLKEELKLLDIRASQILDIRGELTETVVEELSEQLLISGELIFFCRYLDFTGVERTYRGQRRVEEMVVLQDSKELYNGYWKLESEVSIPVWDIKNGRLSFEIIIDYQLYFHSLTFESVLTDFFAGEVTTEKFYVTEETISGQIAFQKDWEVYLHRYAERINQIESRINYYQVKPVEGGWLIRGDGEFVIYYLTREGEFHYSGNFPFYHYIQLQYEEGTTITLNPEIRILDNLLLEDGSLVRIKYLINYHYQLCKKRERCLVVGVDTTEGVETRPIVKMDKVKKTLDYILTIGQGLPNNQVLKILDLQLKFIDYRFKLRDTDLTILGKIEVKVSYSIQGGQERQERFTVPIDMVEKIKLEDDPWPCKKIRGFPAIKNYEYLVNPRPGHPSRNENQLYLAIELEINYRIVGMVNLR